MRTKTDPQILRRGLGVIREYTRMHPKPFFIAVTGAAVFAASTVASAVVLGRVTDAVVVPAFETGETPATLWWGVGAMLAVALLRAAAIMTRRYFAGMTTARVQRTLRLWVLEHYRKLPLSFHRSRATGELMAHADADVIAASEVLHPLPFSTASLMLIVFSIIALVVTDLFLALIGLLVLPAIALLNRVFGSLIEPPATRAQEALGKLAGTAHESFEGTLIVKTLGRSEEEVQRFDAVADAVRRERTLFGRIRAAFDPAFEGVPNLGIIVLLAVGAWRVSTGDVTVGVLVQFVSLFQLLAFPLRLIGWVLADLPRAVVGRTRIQEVLDEPKEERPAGDTAVLPVGPLGVSARDVAFRYGDQSVLDGISFDIAPGRSVALVGSTGAGKSTLTDLIVGLARPSEGVIELGGIDVTTVPPAELQRAAATVFQESFLFATTLRENITMGRAVDDDELHRILEIAQIARFVGDLPKGLDTTVGEKGVTLSGGQRQRVALARALVGHPRLLILDDATSAIDPRIEAAILDALRNELDMTLIVIAHRVSTITLADRVLYLRDGHIEVQGTHDEALKHPGYNALVSAYERAAA